MLGATKKGRRALQKDTEEKWTELETSEGGLGFCVQLSKGFWAFRPGPEALEGGLRLPQVRPWASKEDLACIMLWATVDGSSKRGTTGLYQNGWGLIKA